MVKVFTDAKDFASTSAWGAHDLAEIQGASVRLHWTDEPYEWHVNDGPEVFVVMDGQVEMHYRQSGCEKVVLLETGHILVASSGDEHMAHPVGAARVLVIERLGSR